MLKRLAILAVFLAATQTPMPASGRAPDKQAKAIPPVSAKPPEASHSQTVSKINSTPDAQNSMTSIESTSVPSKRDWLDYTTLGVGILLAGITGFGVFAAFRGLPELKRQAEAAKDAAIATRDSIDISRDTAKRQLRAYLCVSEACVKIIEQQDSDGQLQIHLEGQLHIKNSGQTPAYDVESWLHGSIRDYPENTPVPPPPKGMPRAAAIIPPQEKHIFPAKEVAVFPHIMQALKTPNLAYYVQGEVHYRDIFKGWHCLKVRMFHGGPAGTRTTKDANGVTLGFLVPDSWGNSDEDETQPEGQSPN